MADTVSINIKGLDQLQDKLNRLPPEFSKRALRNGLRPAGQVFQKALKALAHITGKYSTGWMGKHITLSVKTNNLDQGSVKVGFDRKQRVVEGKKTNTNAAYEALWAEFGTIHEPARPFIRPTFESKKSEVLSTFVQKLRDTLSEVFR
jgi:HK97 gp10 family phage protein